MKEHELKCWPQFFEALLNGSKTFEIRVDDRGGFLVDDELRLREWDPVTQTYTGRVTHRRVTYVSDWMQKDGVVVLGLAEFLFGP